MLRGGPSCPTRSYEFRGPNLSSSATASGLEPLQRLLQCWIPFDLLFSIEQESVRTELADRTFGQ